MNVHAAAARGVKVALMLGDLSVYSAQQRAELAATMERMTPEERKAFAAKRGVNNPSDLAWAWAIAAVREGAQ